MRGGIVAAAAIAIAIASLAACGSFDGDVPPPATLDAGRAEASSSAEAGLDADSSRPVIDASKESAYAAAVRADGPVFYLPLDEEKSSPTVSTENASYAHVKCVLGQPGSSNTCARFNGESTITLGALASAGRKPMTFEAWIAIDSAVMGGQEGAPVTQGSGEDGLGIVVLPDKVTFERRIGDVGEQAETNAPLEPGTFHHVVATYDGDAVRLYVDGVLADEEGDDRAMPDTLDKVNVVLGSRETKLLFFHGLVDEVALYDHALGQEAIDRHFAAGPK